MSYDERDRCSGCEDILFDDFLKIVQDLERRGWKFQEIVQKMNDRIAVFEHVGGEARHINWYRRH